MAGTRTLSTQSVRVSIALAMVLCFAACDSPQPPGLCGSIPEQTLFVGESATVDFCFDDPDEDMLDFLLVSSDPGIVTAVATGSTAMVTAISPGNALVTMIATDPTGLKAQQSFRVMVPNRAPVAVGTIADREVMVGDSATVDVSGNFSEPDGQTLSYAAQVSDSAVADVSVAGAVVTIVATAKGEVTVTVTATDPGGLAATQSFRLTVPNRPPVPIDTIPSQTIEAETTAALDLLPYFNDPDGDSLAFSAAVSDSVVVAVSVEDGELTIAALAKGEATVTVTATDTEGLSAQQSFRVTVPNRPPMAVDTIPAQMLYKGNSVEFDLTGYFDDPDGDSLAYSATTSDADVAMASVNGALLTVVAIGQGQATVNITAADTEALAAGQSFTVTVTNRSPMMTDLIPAQTIFLGESVTLTLTDYFSDPDGDALAFAASTSDGSLVTAQVLGRYLTVTAVAKGDAEVTVSATDPGGLAAQQSFTVSVPNRAPLVTDPVPPQTIHLGESTTLDASLHFSDPDGDNLVYTAEISPTTIARVRVSGDRINIRARERGEATVSVTATDPEGLAATQSFALTVPNQGPVAVGIFPILTLGTSGQTTIAISGYFRDPDGDRLEYDATIRNTRIARAAISGSALTLTGVREGETELTITATDPEGLMATQTTGLIVRSGGQGPIAVGTMPSQTVAVGGTRSISVSGYFRHPDGEPLTYRAQTSTSSVATASTEDDVVTITGASTGVTTLTVTARDRNGRTATHRTQVTVNVQARGPQPVGSIPSQQLNENESGSLDADQYFRHPDGSSLRYSARTSNTSVATATAAGVTVTVRGVAEGQTTLTLTATDPAGRSATQSAAVTVSSTSPGPVTVGTIPDHEIDVGEEIEVDLSPYFSHPAGHSLSYLAGTSDAGVVSVDVSGSILEFKGQSGGDATVSAIAQDPDGRTATQSFVVTIKSQTPTTSYRIEVRFHSSVGASARSVILGAASFWESVLADNEFFDYHVGGTASCSGYSTQVDTIDDLMILVGAQDIDGAGGTLGFAGYCIVRTSGEKPILGRMVFDEDDIDRLAQSGDLTDVAIHEIAHVLGFGGNWDDLGLLANPSSSNPDADTHFTGSAAITAFNQAGGTSYGGAKVPVENGGDDGHWRKSVFGLELMTPTIRSGVADPLSAISLQAFSDMGYAVRSGLADSYRLPGSVPAPDIEGGVRLLDLSNDVRIGPVTVVDADGRIVRVIPN